MYEFLFGPGAYAVYYLRDMVSPHQLIADFGLFVSLHSLIESHLAMIDLFVCQVH